MFKKMKQATLLLLCAATMTGCASEPFKTIGGILVAPIVVTPHLFYPPPEVRARRLGLAGSAAPSAHRTSNVFKSASRAYTSKKCSLPRKSWGNRAY